MCAVSMIMDDWSKRNPPGGGQLTYFPSYVMTGPSREEFEALKKEVMALKELLKAAKIYDEETGQPDCEMKDKVELIRKIAELVGIDITDVFPMESTV